MMMMMMMMTMTTTTRLVWLVWLGLVIALRPQTPKHIRGGWSLANCCTYDCRNLTLPLPKSLFGTKSHKNEHSLTYQNFFINLGSL
jgi:hypothetical protein